MSRILLPSDGSDMALRAVQYVIGRASESKVPMEVLLLNVQHPLEGRHGAAAPGTLDTSGPEQRLRDEGNKALAPARRLLEAAGIKHQHHVEFGEPVELIVHYAQIYHCEEIVMGTHGKASIFDRVLGSISTKTLRATKLPVVLVG